MLGVVRNTEVTGAQEFKRIPVPVTFLLGVT